MYTDLLIPIYPSLILLRGVQEGIKHYFLLHIIKFRTTCWKIKKQGLVFFFFFFLKCMRVEQMHMLQYSVCKWVKAQQLCQNPWKGVHAPRILTDNSGHSAGCSHVIKHVILGCCVEVFSAENSVVQGHWNRGRANQTSQSMCTWKNLLFTMTPRKL